MQKIITVTMNPAVDKSAAVPDVVAERKLRCVDPRREPGGGGINVARAIRKLEGEATAIYPAGGPTGEILTDLLEVERIASERVDVEAWTRENLTIFEESTERQYRFGMPGARIQEADWRACLTRIEGADAPDYVVASGSLPPGVPEDFYAQASRTAKRTGARFVLDASGAALREAASEGVFLLKPNAREFGELVGETVESEEQQEKLARGLIERGSCEVLVLSLGAAGVLLATRDRLERVRSPSVRIRSKVGAGDSMLAAIVLGLARGQNVRGAVCFGVAAGAAAVMTPGTELCRREDVHRLHARLMACASA
jgi:6-phosphofructokinase 2